MKKKCALFCVLLIGAAALLTTAAGCGEKDHMDGLREAFTGITFPGIKPTDPVVTFSAPAPITNWWTTAAEQGDVDFAAWCVDGFSVTGGGATILVIKFDTSRHASRYEEMVKRIKPASLKDGRQSLVSRRPSSGSRVYVCAAFASTYDDLTLSGAEGINIFQEYFGKL